ncbi:hypothetical protein, partial [Priestia megaterium]|uniref:hypothetical protein n=1 Tax=Priestia megaterium TaxID=1404 RepID=UPI0035B5EBB1
SCRAGAIVAYSGEAEVEKSAFRGPCALAGAFRSQPVITPCTTFASPPKNRPIICKYNPVGYEIGRLSMESRDSSAMSRRQPGSLFPLG